MRKFLEERKVHRAFEISLLLKGALAVAEVIGGIAAYYVTQSFLMRAVVLLTGHELAEDPHDLAASYLLHAVQQFSGGTRHFATYYLLGHGVIKLWLIAGLLKKQLWYYPVAIAVFGLFVVYQLYRFSFTHSVSLLLITALDLAVMVLTWYERHFLRQTERAHLC